MNLLDHYPKTIPVPKTEEGKRLYRQVEWQNWVSDFTKERHTPAAFADLIDVGLLQPASHDPEKLSVRRFHPLYTYREGNGNVDAVVSDMRDGRPFLVLSGANWEPKRAEPYGISQGWLWVKHPIVQDCDRDNVYMVKLELWRPELSFGDGIDSSTWIGIVAETAAWYPGDLSEPPETEDGYSEDYVPKGSHNHADVLRGWPVEIRLTAHRHDSTS